MKKVKTLLCIPLFLYSEPLSITPLPQSFPVKTGSAVTEDYSTQLLSFGSQASEARDLLQLSSACFPGTASSVVSSTLRLVRIH